MKLAVLFATIFFPFYTFSQAIKVEVTGAPEELKKGTELTFNIVCEQSLSAEVAVFMQTYLGYQANAELTPGVHTYKVNTADWKLGQYYILVKGEHVHVQHEFVLKE